MLAAVLERPGTVTIRDVAAPRAAAGRALVRVAQAGVCGTDVKIADGDIPVTANRVLGHEMTGWVETPGRHGAPAAGTPVMVNPAAFCGRCDLCRRDLPHLCRQGGLLGRDADGCFAELVAVDEALLHPVPDTVHPDAAALLQVLSTCVHAQSGLRLSPDDSAAVIGLGVTGLLHLQLLRARGLKTVIGITGSEWKHDLARRLGASAVASPAGAADAAGDATEGLGARVVIDCAGTQATFALATRLAGAGGTVVAFGIIPGTFSRAPSGTVSRASDGSSRASGTVSRAADGSSRASDVTPYEWYLKELTIHSPRAARPRDCDTAISLCARGRLDLGSLVTVRYPLARLRDALAAARDPAQLKVVIDVGLHG